MEERSLAAVDHLLLEDWLLIKIKTQIQEQEECKPDHLELK